MGIAGHRTLGAELCEERTGTNGGTVSKRFFPYGSQEGSDEYDCSRDHLGSVREVTDDSGSLVARYDYDPWGRRTQLYGTAQPPFGYAGHYLHGPTGLNLAVFRAYDPDLGQWLSRDPIGEAGGIRLHGYVGGDPVSTIDPSGFFQIYPDTFIGPLMKGDYRESDVTMTPCGPIPPGPPNVDVNSNMSRAEENPDPIWFSWINLTEWNYKRLGGKYEDFGNFNYGAVGVAWGVVSDGTLHWAAGVVQSVQGTSKPEYGGSLFPPEYPYGDDPLDQEWMQGGMDYANCLCSKQ